jgi:hypothetical protein
MNVTGTALNTASIVLTEFDFANTISNYSHGTTYHWDWKQPSPYGKQKDFDLTMEATHDFIAVASSSSSSSPWQGVVYHGDVPSWGVQNNVLFGVLLRNSPGMGCQGYGANGWDNMTHSVRYSLRIPSSFSLINAHREAASFHTPMMAFAVAPNVIPKTTIPPNLSLASVLSPSTAFITVIKKGTFNPASTIIRIYSPLNKEEKVTIQLSPMIASGSSQVQYVSALENPLQDQKGLGVISDSRLVLKLKKALTSIQIW